MDKLIEEFFEDNFDLLMAESGHRLSDDAKAAALDQVKLYWSRLRPLAEKVTETEVQLVLPNQRTPAGRPYSIEGIVDIVQEDEETCMYDIKTHDANYVRSHIDKYEDQLNVYAHVWQGLRDQPLDKVAIISTAPDRDLKRSLRENRDVDWSDGDTWPTGLLEQIKKWDPIIDIDFDLEGVSTTVENFGRVVDSIEDGCFSPPDISVLNQPMAKGRTLVFGTEVCGNCDVRFSCQSYREFSIGRRKEGLVSEFIDQEVRPEEDDLDEWLDQTGSGNISSVNLVTTEEREEEEELDAWLDQATDD